MITVERNDLYPRYITWQFVFTLSTLGFLVKDICQSSRTQEERMKLEKPVPSTWRKSRPELEIVNEQHQPQSGRCDLE